MSEENTSAWFTPVLLAMAALSSAAVTTPASREIPAAVADPEVSMPLPLIGVIPPHDPDQVLVLLLYLACQIPNTCPEAVSTTAIWPSNPGAAPCPGNRDGVGAERVSAPGLRHGDVVAGVLAVTADAGTMVTP